KAGVARTRPTPNSARNSRRGRFAERLLPLEGGLALLLEGKDAFGCVGAVARDILPHRLGIEGRGVALREAVAQNAAHRAKRNGWPVREAGRERLRLVQQFGVLDAFVDEAPFRRLLGA